MAESMRVDVAALRRAEPTFDALASGEDAVARRLASALDAQGACWGVDEMGLTFANGYLPAAEQVRDAFGELGAGLSGAGGAVGWVSDNVDAAEGRAQGRLS
jgi:hypothetical protein